MRGLRDKLSAFSELTGTLVAWLTLLMVLGTFVIVVLRYVFDLGWIWMQESITWMHAAVFMLGAAYTLKRDEHVRVDIFYRKMSPKRRALVDLLGTLFFLLPISAFLIVSSWGYMSASWSIHEASPEAGGLPYPFIPILKALIPVTAALLALQGVAELITNWLVLTGRSQEGGGPTVPQGEII
jgi:TRAP-type mannitol/chloroaromatic compound transport system permease small subunit